MPRLKLIEYLNDPSLLRTISLEEMQAWAAEVPYAGLVQRLYAQKLALEKASTDDQDRAATIVALSAANPTVAIESIEDFKQLMLSASDDTSAIEPEESPVISEVEETIVETEDRDIGSEINSAVDDHEPIMPSADPAEMTAQTDVPIQEIEPQTETPHSHDPGQMDQEADSGFISWVADLVPLHEHQKDETVIELSDKEIASDALAQLLVSQGHYSRAIDMYEILMLKNPDKSSYFAAQIEKLKAL